jgi:hypothetical protein
MHDFFLRKFTKSRARPPRGRYAPVPYQSSILVQYTSTAIVVSTARYLGTAGIQSTLCTVDLLLS